MIIVRDFNTRMYINGQIIQTEINKVTLDLNDRLDYLNLTDTYREFGPKAAEYTFFSSAHRTFSRRDHMLGHKASLSKFKKAVTISSIFSHHNAMR